MSARVNRSALSTAHRVGADLASADDPVAEALGRDLARHGLPLPDRVARPGDPLWLGWQAGQAARDRDGARPWPADLRTRRWLQLRLRAWLRGEAFELAEVTPHLVGRLDTSHCPVTRCALDRAALTAPTHVPTHASTRAPQVDDAVLISLDPARGVAAGLLVMLSRRAAAWVDCHDLDELSEPLASIDGPTGRDAAQRERLACLMSLVTPMPHHEAAVRPLRVLPTNRLHLANPVQALQALLSRLLLRSGWTSRLQGWQALLPQPAQREALQRFFLALLARVLEAGHPAEPLQRRWAVEDAWRDAEVLRLWTRLALQLDAARCTALIERAAALGLCDTAVLCHPDGRDAVPTTSAAAADRGPLRPVVRTGLAPRRSLSPALHRALPRPLARPTPLPIARSGPVQLSLPWAA
ncbi:hypothetical protein [Leptothrix discophora]|uniref:Uncharacterized protein n=1 Tax=Leptothrix discophora TaxID=89 RepID=A0ABT9FZL3_LEPDI|nr:hypothetical protein [Leptothrix discophora]MDP4299660.1 hypothetical protein [Leptothrix discophora]